MATIEITGPDDQGQYTVEVESDDAEASESGDASSGNPSSGAMPGAPGAGAPAPDADESSEAPGGNTVQCGSIKEVLQAVKSALSGEGVGGNPQAAWDQEAAKTAAAKNQSQAY